MKKLILIICILAIALPSYSGGVTDAKKAVIARRGAAPAGDSCTGTLIHSWHAENENVTVGTPAGCSAVDETATLGSGAAIDTDGTPVPIDGSGALYLDGTYSRAVFDCTQALIGEGKVTGYLNVASYNTGIFFSARIGGTTEYILLNLGGGATDISINIQHKGNGTIETYELPSTNGSRVVNTWYYFEVEWKGGVGGGNDLHMKMCDSDGTSNCDEETRAEVFGTQAGSLATFEIGDQTQGTMFTGHVDIIKVYNDSQF